MFSKSFILLKKIFNTFCYPRYSYHQIDLELFKKNNPNKKNYKKIFFFLKNINDDLSWAKGDFGDYRDPNDFVDFRKDIDQFFLDYLIEHTNKNSSILDLGCNSGRHLNYLYTNGYSNLYGVDIMKSALENFKEKFPNAHKITKLNNNSFQSFLSSTKDNQFDCLYTVGATIELIHPSFDIISHLCRVTKNQLFLLIFPNIQSYPRFYSYELKRNNFIFVNEIKVTKDLYLLHYKSKN